MIRNAYSRWSLGMFAAITLGVPACGGDVADPMRPETLPAGTAAARIKVVGRSTRQAGTQATSGPRAKNALSGTRADGSIVDVTYAHVGVSKIKFKSIEQMGVATEVGLEGKFDLDLLSGTSSPDLSAVTIPAGLYKKMKVKIDQGLADGSSVVVRGTWTPAGGGAAVPFEYVTDEEFEFEIENQTGFELSERALSDVLVLFDLDAWFAKVDFASAMVGADGTIHIDDRNNERLGDSLEEAIDDSAEVGEDEDHDGDAEIDEDHDGRDDDEREGDSDDDEADDDRGEGEDHDGGMGGAGGAGGAGGNG